MEQIQQKLLCHLRTFSNFSDNGEITKYLRLCVSILSFGKELSLDILNLYDLNRNLHVIMWKKS